MISSFQTLLTTATCATSIRILPQQRSRRSLFWKWVMKAEGALAYAVGSCPKLRALCVDDLTQKFFLDNLAGIARQVPAVGRCRLTPGFRS